MDKKLKIHNVIAIQITTADIIKISKSNFHLSLSTFKNDSIKC